MLGAQNQGLVLSQQATHQLSPPAPHKVCYVIIESLLITEIWVGGEEGKEEGVEGKRKKASKLK